MGVSQGWRYAVTQAGLLRAGSGKNPFSRHAGAGQGPVPGSCRVEVAAALLAASRGLPFAPGPCVKSPKSQTQKGTCNPMHPAALLLCCCCVCLPPGLYTGEQRGPIHTIQDRLPSSRSTTLIRSAKSLCAMSVSPSWHLGMRAWKSLGGYLPACPNARHYHCVIASRSISSLL